MKKLLKFCAIAAFCLPVVAKANSYFPFSTMYNFGDSLSDIGNVAGTPETTPSADGAPKSIWVNFLAADLGMGAAPSSRGGNDYAQGGANTGPLNFQDSFTVPTVLQQTQTFLNNTNGHVDPNALYTVWGGANDLKDGIFYAAAQGYTPVQQNQFGLALVGDSTGNIVDVVTLLHKAGARYILVPNLPNLGATPALSNSNFLYGEVYAAAYAAAIKAGYSQFMASIIAGLYAGQNATPQAAAQAAASGTALSQSYNNQLLSSLNRSGFHVIQVDIYGLLNAVQSHYRQFGFNAADSSYMIPGVNSDGTPGLQPNYGNDPNPNHYIFYDGYHPSQETDVIGSEYFYSALEGSYYAAMLAQAPLTVMDAQNQQIQAELLGIETGVTNQPICKWRSFATGGYSTFSQDQLSVLQHGFNETNKSFTVGADYRYTENTVFGFAVGRSMGDAELAHNQGGFDIDENMINFFGGYQFLNSQTGSAYVNGSVGYGNIDFSNSHRNFMLGIVPETVTGSTTGDHYAADVNLGYNFSLANNALKTGPLVTLDYQHVTVNPFKEVSNNFELANNTAFDALQYGKQQNDSLIGGAGWQLSYLSHINNVDVLPFVQATYNHQFLNMTNNVEAGVTTLPGSEFSFPVKYPDSDYGAIGAGVQGIFSSGLALNFSYNANVGQSDQRSQMFMIGASMAL